MGIIALMVRTPDIDECIDLYTRRPLGKSPKKRLLHFMTGGCVNCVRLLRKLRAFALPDDVEVVTVHTAKFDAEAREAYVRRLAQNYRIDTPLIHDAERKLADAFALKAWPTLVLVSPDGYELGRAAGEDAPEKLFQRDCETPKSALREGVVCAVTAWEEGLAVGYGGGVVVLDSAGRRLFALEGFAEPGGLAVAGGRLYVSDRAEGSVTAVDLATQSRRLLARHLRSPAGLTHANGALFVAESGAHRIVRVEASGARVYAGLGFEGLREGSALGEALFAQPEDVAWLDGALWTVDAEGSALRKIENGRVSTPVGWDLFTWGDRDGVGEEVLLQHPQGLCAGVGGCGNHRLFIADTYNGKIKAYDPLTGRVMTVAKDLASPVGVAKRGCSLYIALSAHREIARLDLATFQLERIRLP